MKKRAIQKRFEIPDPMLEAIAARLSAEWADSPTYAIQSFLADCLGLARPEPPGTRKSAARLMPDSQVRPGTLEQRRRRAEKKKNNSHAH